MGDTPIPDNYTEVPRGPERKRLLDSLPSSPETKKKEVYWTSRDVIWKFFSEDFRYEEFFKMLESLESLEYLTKDEKIDYVVKFLLHKK